MVCLVEYLWTVEQIVWFVNCLYELVKFGWTNCMVCMNNCMVCEQIVWTVDFYELFVSNTTRRDTLSKIQKYCLSLAKTKAKRLLQGINRILWFARGLAPRPHAKQAKNVPPKPSRRGLAPKGLGRISNSPIHSRPGSANVLVTSISTELLWQNVTSGLNAPNHSRKR